MGRLIDVDKLKDILEYAILANVSADDANTKEEKWNDWIQSVIDTASTVEAIPIPKGATNGDMIKAMFPKAEFDNARPFTDGRWETMNLDTENQTRAIYEPTQLRTYKNWWNAPYKENEDGRS